MLFVPSRHMFRERRGNPKGWMKVGQPSSDKVGTSVKEKLLFRGVRLPPAHGKSADGTVEIQIKPKRGSYRSI